MPLEFGWRANEVRESIWKGDSALGEIPTAAAQAWAEDGDASHLEPYVLHGKPARITYRNLNADESRVMQAYFVDAVNPIQGYTRALLMCFRIGVNFPGLEEINDPSGSGVKHGVIVNERGIRMLAEPFVQQLEITYPGIVGFYGRLIFDGSRTTEKEKKASSPPSTPTPSSEAASTAATSDPSQPAAGA